MIFRDKPKKNKSPNQYKDFFKKPQILVKSFQLWAAANFFFFPGEAPLSFSRLP